jgi:hypothetical protein
MLAVLRGGHGTVARVWCLAAEAAALRACAAASATTTHTVLLRACAWPWPPPAFTPTPARRPYTRLVPKVSNIGAQGTLRLGLSRFAPRLPGFGALLVSFARNPQVGWVCVCVCMCVHVCAAESA